VARGALLIEHILDQTKIPSLYTVGLLFDTETYDPQLHKDALAKNLVFQDYWYSEGAGEDEWVVHDRITWLLRQV
jgi:hypothetical protein